MENQQKPKSIFKKTGFWVFMILVGFPMIYGLFFLDDEDVTEPEKQEVTQAENDSILAARAKEDSIAKVKQAENLAIAKKLENKFRISKDDFEETSWIYHKSTTEYTNTNSVHLYFSQSENGHTYNLRFVVQYEDDSWLFIQKMIFNIDGENYTYYPKEMSRDCGYGGRIWEWCDEQASKDHSLVSKISKANSVKVKLVGKQYSDTRKMSRSQLKAFKEVLQYYTALGGTY